MRMTAAAFPHGLPSALLLLLLLLVACSLPSPTHGMVAQTWGTKAWNWGYASGGAHDAAALLRRKLSTEDSRRAWLGALVSAADDDHKEPDLEEIKLCFALRCQRAFSQRLIGGFAPVYDSLTAGRYEGDDSNAARFWQDLEEQLPSVGVSLPLDTDAATAAVAAAVAVAATDEEGGRGGGGGAEKGGSEEEERRQRALVAVVLLQMGLLERGL